MLTEVNLRGDKEENFKKKQTDSEKRTVGIQRLEKSKKRFLGRKQ